MRRNQGNAGTVTSERQKAANQANSLHSTGPRTPEGKAAVRLNALRHGLLTRDVVLPGEDADAFEDLLNQVRADLSPVGPIEELLVDQVINAMWRLGRLERAETALGPFLRGGVRHVLTASHHGPSRAYGSDGSACAG